MSACHYWLSYSACKAHAPYYAAICDLSECTLSPKLHDYWENVIEYKIFVLIFSTFFFHERFSL